MFLGHQMTRSDTFACILMYIRPLMPKKLTISFSGYITSVAPVMIYFIAFLERGSNNGNFSISIN